MISFSRVDASHYEVVEGEILVGFLVRRDIQIPTRICTGAKTGRTKKSFEWFTKIPGMDEVRAYKLADLQLHVSGEWDSKRLAEANKASLAKFLSRS